MISKLKGLFYRKKLTIKGNGNLSLIEFDPSKHYFVVVNEGAVNIDDVLSCRAKGSGGSMTIVREDKQ